MRRPILPQRLDVTFALKAFCMVGGLSAADRRVAAALLDHFNSKTGRCDPAVGSLALMLGISDRSVTRAIRRLVRHQLYDCDLHGGNFQRNSYQPLWHKYRELEKLWIKKKKVVRARFSPAAMSPPPSQERLDAGDNSVTQTSPSYLSHKTSAGRPTSEGLRESAGRTAIHHTDNSDTQIDGKLHVKRSRAQQALRDTAQRRWDNDLLIRCVGDPVRYGHVIETIDGELAAAATDAEITARGAGLLTIVNGLVQRGVFGAAAAAVMLAEV